MPLHSSMRPRPRRRGKYVIVRCSPSQRPLLCPGGPLFTRLRSVPSSHDLGTFANSSGCGGMLGLTWCVGMFGWFWYIGYLGMFGSNWLYWKGSGVRERDWQASCDTFSSSTIFASFGSIDIVNIKRQIISSPQCKFCYFREHTAQHIFYCPWWNGSREGFDVFACDHLGQTLWPSCFLHCEHVPSYAFIKLSLQLVLISGSYILPRQQHVAISDDAEDNRKIGWMIHMRQRQTYIEVDF